MCAHPRSWRVSVSCGLLALLLAGCGDPSPLGGPSLRLVNGSAAEAGPFRVHVTGETYDVPPIAPGDSLSVRLRPRGESVIVVESPQVGRLDTIPGSYVEASHPVRYRAIVEGDSMTVVGRAYWQLSLGPAEEVRLR